MTLTGKIQAQDETAALAKLNAIFAQVLKDRHYHSIFACDSGSSAQAFALIAGVSILVGS